MSYTSKQAAQESQQVESGANKVVSPQFADQRASTSVQLKQQQMMGAVQRAGVEEEPMQGKFATVQRAEDEELLQGKFATAQLAEDEELLQGKFATAQLAGMEEEEPMQGKFESAQLMEEEEPLQGKSDALQKVESEALLQGKFSTSPVTQLAGNANNTGLPNQLKAGIESLSGMSMDAVKVHYNSDKPAQLNAHAYAQGTDIHVAPGQEKHLPHEAWHVVQQAQGRVKPTRQMKAGVPVNDDTGLETEADVMGAKALESAGATIQNKTAQGNTTGSVIQKLKIGKDQVKTAEDLAVKMGITKENVLIKFNEALGNFPNITEPKLNTFLNATTSSVRVSITEHDRFMARIAKTYRDNYMEKTDSTFVENLKGIEANDDYKTIMDKNGINYGEGEEDGASVEDTYNKTLACTLFALLELKPGFLGASNPKELHQILRSNPKTKNYDLDPQVAQIRIAAGLSFRAPAGSENTVSKLTGKVENRGNKYIIDPSGEAHTFALYYKEGKWKKYDNDTPDGTVPPDVDIRVIWHA